MGEAPVSVTRTSSHHKRENQRMNAIDTFAVVCHPVATQGSSDLIVEAARCYGRDFRALLKDSPQRP